jgi:hypothetical protein
VLARSEEIDADTQGLAAALSSLGIYDYVVTDLIEMARSSVLHEMIVTAVEQGLEQRSMRPWSCRLWWPNGEPPNWRKQRNAQQ